MYFAEILCNILLVGFHFSFKSYMDKQIKIWKHQIDYFKIVAAQKCLFS
jgi:hypothetical protein